MARITSRPASPSGTSLPAQTGNGGKFLQTDGTATSWATAGTSVAFADAGLWAASTAYTVGQIVTWLQTRYVCGTAHTSASTFDATKWVAVGDAPRIAAMEGVKFVGYGSSYMLGSNASQNGYSPASSVVHLGGTSFLDKTGARCHSSYVENFGQASTWAQDICGNMFGGGNSIGSTNAFKGTNPQSNSDRMAVIVTLAENDVFSGAHTATQLASLDNALKAIYRLVTGGTLTDDQSWSTPFTSTADVWCSSQHYGETTTQNASTSTSFTGTSCTVVLVGYADSTGGTAQVQVDGVTQATVNLANQAATSIVRTRVQVPVYISGLAGGSHTVTVTKTDAGGTKVGLDCLIGPSTTQGALLIVVKPVVDAASNLAPTLAQIDSTVTALGGASSKLVVVDPAIGFDAATMILTLHPNDKGHAHFSNRILDECTRSGVTWFDGLNKVAV